MYSIQEASWRELSFNSFLKCAISFPIFNILRSFYLIFEATSSSHTALSLPFSALNFSSHHPTLHFHDSSFSLYVRFKRCLSKIRSLNLSRYRPFINFPATPSLHFRKMIKNLSAKMLFFSSYFSEGKPLISSGYAFKNSHLVYIM